MTKKKKPEKKKITAREIAIQAAEKAGKILMKGFYSKLKKGAIKEDGQLQLRLDKASERIIIKTIEEAFPKHNILSEECGYTNKGSQYTWIIDPLDGTHNYFFKIPTFAVSIALQKKKEVILGLIYLPFFPRLYVAEKGKGAFKGNKKIRVSRRKKLSEAAMLYDSSFYRNKEEVFETFSKLADKTFCVRVLGSTTLNFGLVMARKADFFVMHGTKPWDIAAGALLVEEAGGEVTDFEGKHWTTQSKNLVASNGLLHNKVLKIINEKSKKKDK